MTVRELTAIFASLPREVQDCQVHFDCEEFCVPINGGFVKNYDAPKGMGELYLTQRPEWEY